MVLHVLSILCVRDLKNHKICNMPFFVSAPCFGARHLFALMGFLGFVNVYAMRVNLSVAIVVMVNNTNNDNQGNGTSYNSNSTCPVPSGPNSTTPDKNQVKILERRWHVKIIMNSESKQTKSICFRQYNSLFCSNNFVKIFCQILYETLLHKGLAIGLIIFSL